MENLVCIYVLKKTFISDKKSTKRRIKRPCRGKRKFQITKDINEQNIEKLSRKLEHNFSISNLYPACNCLKIHYQNFLLCYKNILQKPARASHLYLKKKKN